MDFNQNILRRHHRKGNFDRNHLKATRDCVEKKISGSYQEIKQKIGYLLWHIDNVSKHDKVLFQIQRKLDSAIKVHFCDLPLVALERICSIFLNTTNNKNNNNEYMLLYLL